MSIEVRQSAEQESPGRWKWSVWLEGQGDELEDIVSVTYQLHPTFRNPIREVKDRQSGFRLNASGWGQFMIYLTLHHRDGTHDKRQHWLRFDAGAPSKAVDDVLEQSFGDRSPTAFLSYSVADAVTASAVRQRLEDQGVSVLDTSSVEAGENLNDGIEEMINRADFGVTIVSDVDSEWVNQETRQMQRHKLPVFQVNAETTPDSRQMHLKVQAPDKSGAERFATLIEGSQDLKKLLY